MKILVCVEKNIYNTEVLIELTISVSVGDHSGLWGEGFPQEGVKQIVAGTVRRPVGVLEVADRNLVTQRCHGVLEALGDLGVRAHLLKGVGGADL